MVYAIHSLESMKAKLATCKISGFKLVSVVVHYLVRNPENRFFSDEGHMSTC